MQVYEPHILRVLLGQQVQLKQAVATAKNGIAATYTADLIFDAPIDSNQVKNMGNVTYTLVYGGTTTTYTSSGELYAVGENAQLIMQVTDYMSGVTVDDSSENAGNFLTTLIEGSQDYVDLSKSSTTHFTCSQAVRSARKLSPCWKARTSPLIPPSAQPIL